MVEAGFAVAFIGGIAVLFSPCAAMLLPSFFAFAFDRVGTLISRIFIFYLGLITVLIPMGAFASVVSKFLTFERGLTIAAVVVIILGLLYMFGFGFSLGPSAIGAQRNPASTLGVYMLGIGYGFSSGCSGPILGSVLALAAIGGKVGYAVILLAVFGLGMVIPLMILAVLWNRFSLASKRWMKPRQVVIGPVKTTLSQIIVGALFVVIGVLLLLGSGSLGLGLSAASQITLETRIGHWASAISNPIALVILAVVVILLVWAWLDERHRNAVALSQDEGTEYAEDESTKNTEEAADDADGSVADSLGEIINNTGATSATAADPSAPANADPSRN